MPGELRRLVRRCLSKSADQRLQSMKDLALELAEIAEEYDTLSMSSGSGAATSVSDSGTAAGASIGRYSRTIVAAALLIGVLGLGAGAWSLWWRGAGTGDSGSFEAMTITRLMPELVDAVLSPDGRQLAFTQRQGGQVSLWVRQVATASDIQILPARRSLRSLTFRATGTTCSFFRRTLTPANPPRPAARRRGSP